MSSVTDEDVSVQISGSRTALEDGTASIDIRYGATMLEISYDTTDATETETTASETVTIENENGVVLTLTETETLATGDLVVTGSITYEETVYATIEDLEDILIISYTDGVNESL